MKLLITGGKGMLGRTLQNCNKEDKFFIISVACIIFAIIMRILYYIKYPVDVRDSFKYKEIIELWISTKKIPNGEGIPPLGLYILKIPTEHFNCDIIHGGTIMNMLLGLCIVSIIIQIAKEIVSSNIIIFLIGVIAATHPSLVDYSCHMTRENTYLVFFSACTLFLIKYIKKKRWIDLAIASFLSASAYLCRHEALEIVFFMMFIILFSQTQKKLRKIAHVFLFLITYSISFFVISYSIGASTEYYKSYSAFFPKVYDNSVFKMIF